MALSTYSIVMHRVFELRRLIWQVLGAPERKMLSVWREQSSLLGSVFFLYVTLSLRYIAAQQIHTPGRHSSYFIQRLIKFTIVGCF